MLHSTIDSTGERKRVIHLAFNPGMKGDYDTSCKPAHTYTQVQIVTLNMLLLPWTWPFQRDCSLSEVRTWYGGDCPHRDKFTHTLCVHKCVRVDIQIDWQEEKSKYSALYSTGQGLPFKVGDACSHASLNVFTGRGHVLYICVCPYVCLSVYAVNGSFCFRLPSVSPIYRWNPGAVYITTVVIYVAKFLTDKKKL